MTEELLYFNTVECCEICSIRQVLLTHKNQYHDQPFYVVHVHVYLAIAAPLADEAWPEYLGAHLSHPTLSHFRVHCLLLSLWIN